MEFDESELTYWFSRNHFNGNLYITLSYKEDKFTSKQISDEGCFEALMVELNRVKDEVKREVTKK